MKEKLVIAEVLPDEPASEDRVTAEMLPSAENNKNEDKVIIAEVLPSCKGAVKLDMDDARYFAPAVGKKAKFEIVSGPLARPPDGVTGVLFSPSGEQNFFPKVKCTPISMDDKRYLADVVTETIQVPKMSGEYFVVYEDGEVRGVLAKGGTFLALNFTISFVSEIRTYIDESNYSTAFLIRVTRKSGAQEDIAVKSTEYGRIYEIIKKRMPGVFRHANAANAAAEYFAVSYDLRGDIPVENRTLFTGWSDIANIIRYRIGTAPYYASMLDPYSVNVAPDVAIREGLRFLEVGKNGPAVSIIFLFANVAYLLFWFARHGIRFQSALYVVGPTGVLKTSVVKVLANVLDRGQLSNGIRMTSTEASAKSVVKRFRDTFYLVDDHSNNNASNNAKSIKLRFDLTRLIADDTVETKMDYAEESNISASDFRTVVVFTGEDLMDVGQSTELRTVTAELGPDTIDEKRLALFQRENGPMPNYFAVFIQYLTQYGRDLEKTFRDTYLLYRADYGKRFPDMRRLADTAAQLKLTTDVICQFAVAGNCGDIRSLRETLETAIDTCLNSQAKQAASVEPYERFVVALFESLTFGQRSADSGVAESKAVYTENSGSFIGYDGTKDVESVVYLRFEAAWILALQYFRKSGESFFQSKKKIKSQLVDNGVILANDFRPGKGPRKRLTVFRMDAVNRILEKQEV